MKFMQTILLIGLLAIGVFNGPTLLKSDSQVTNEPKHAQMDQGVQEKNEQPAQSVSEDRKLQNKTILSSRLVGKTIGNIPPNPRARVVVRRRLVSPNMIRQRVIRRVPLRRVPAHKLVIKHQVPIQRKTIIHRRAPVAQKPMIRIRRRMNDGQQTIQTQAHDSSVVSYDLFKTNPQLQNAIVNPPPPPTDNEIAIKDAMSSTGSKPSIIVINQLPQNSSYMAANKAIPNGSGNSLPLPQRPQVITFAQIDNLVTVAGSIGNIVDELYKIMPQEEQEQTDGGAESNMNSFLENTGKAILFYKQVREFVLFTYQKRNDLLEELQFLKDNVVLFKISESDMLRFYGLDDEYFTAKNKCQLFEEKDPKFKYYWSEISDRTHDYEYSVNTVMIETKRLEAVILSLIKQFDALSENKFDNSVINSLDKIDSVLMILARIAEIKDSVIESVNSLQTNLINLKQYRKNVAEVINNASELAEYYRMNGGTINLPKTETSGVDVLSFKILATLGTLLVML